MGFAVQSLENHLSETNDSSVSALSHPQKPHLRLVHSHTAAPETKSYTNSREIALLCGILIVLQIADLLLTAVGVHNFGVQAEGNPLIGGLMHTIGVFPALVTVKFIAILTIFGLYRLSRHVHWVGTALRVVIAIYLCAAIIPWTSLLVVHLA